MKKLFIYFSLLTFSISLCYAQDTIVLRSGQKLPVKIMWVTNRAVAYSTPGNIQLAIKSSEVNYIRYKDGTVYTVPHDAADKPAFYITASGGVGIPAFNSYGYETSATNSGFGRPGPAFGATLGVDLYHGWGIVVTYSHITIQCEASEFLSDANSDFSFITFTNSVTATGNYNITNGAYMAGGNKTNDYKFGDIGLHLLAGDLSTRIPTMQGVANNVWNAFLGSPATYTLYTSYGTQNNLVFELGIYGDIKITSHIFLHTAFDMLFSKIINNGSYNFVNITTGKSFATGQYGDYTISSADPVTLTIGLKYLF